MCQFYGVVTSPDKVCEKFKLFELKCDFDWQNKYLVKPLEYALVITDKEPKQLQLFKFGYTPEGSTKELNICNVEEKGIVYAKRYMRSIRSKRCVIIATHYYSMVADKTYCVHLRNNQKPFGFAGIWDVWVNPQNQEVVKSFAIITTQGNEVTNAIGSNVTPCILKPGYEMQWLKSDLDIQRVLRQLVSCPSDLMDTYPIRPFSLDIALNDRSIVEPIGKSYWASEYQKLVEKRKREVEDYNKSISTNPKKKLKVFIPPTIDEVKRSSDDNF